MLNKSILIITTILIVGGCANTSVPIEVHNKTTKKISYLEEEGDKLEEEGQEKLYELSTTLNQSIN